MTPTRRNETLFWIFTIAVLLPTAGSGVPELFMAASESTLQTLHRLGYPIYLIKILGFAKILGAIAIIARRFSRIQEWAFAGFSFLFLGATASHIFARDFLHAPIPFVFFGMLMASYFYSTKLSVAV